MPADDVTAAQHLRESADNLRRIRGEVHGEPLHRIDDLLDAVDHADALASLGSCERGSPYADLFLVIRADGTKVYRCTHDPAHPDVPA
jgi:hypothetical protein